MNTNISDNLVKLAEVLEKISRSEKIRDNFIRKIVEFEKEIQIVGIDVREEITGIIVDALFEKGQVLTKQISDGTVFDFPYLSKIARDFIMSDPQIPDHVWEPQTTRLMIFLSEIKRAKHSFIAGAYFGEQAIPLAKITKNWNGLVHAFEPNKTQFEFLQRNIIKNHIMNIIPVNLALWDVSYKKVKILGEDAYGSTSSSTESEMHTIDTITIEDYANERKIEKIDLIVLDIEGGELKVLKGAEKFLSMPKDDSPILIFEIHKKYVDWSHGLANTEIIKYISSFGYSIFAIRDIQSNQSMIGKPIELVTIDTAYIEGPPHGFNLLAIKKTELIQHENIKILQNVSPKLLRHGDPKLHHPVGGF